MSLLANLPSEDRPRERLLAQGSQTLSLQELIAILISTGTKGKSVLVLAQELTQYFGGLRGLLEASISELVKVKGIGRAKAIQLKAAFEIARRCSSMESTKKAVIRDAQDAYLLLKSHLADQKQEVMVALLKDIKKQLICIETIAVGTLSEILVHPREVFYPAVRHKAYSFVIAHNHPSGDPSPSQADIDLTCLLLHSSKVMGIPLDDHLVLGSSSYISFKERGLLP
jgi:DNA repair protein RadC